MTKSEVTQRSDPPAYYRVGDVAAMLGIGAKKVYLMSAAGKIPGGFKLGTRSLRFNREIVDKWFTSLGTNKPEGSA